jgi:c-di-AMP phosphodiesterase-like protein
MEAFIALIITCIWGVIICFATGEVGFAMMFMGLIAFMALFLLNEARRERKMVREIDEKIAREREAGRCGP